MNANRKAAWFCAALVMHNAAEGRRQDLEPNGPALAHAAAATAQRPERWPHPLLKHERERVTAWAALQGAPGGGWQSTYRMLNKGIV